MRLRGRFLLFLLGWSLSCSNDPTGFDANYYVFLPGPAVTSLAVSPDATFFATAGGTLYKMDLLGQLLAQVTPNYGSTRFCVQGDGRVLTVGTVDEKYGSFAVQRFDSLLSTDSSFGNAGVAVYAPTATASTYLGDPATAISALGEQALIATHRRAGCSSSSADNSLQVIRITLDGKLDSVFGTGGAAGLPAFNCISQAWENFLTVNSDGKILVLGLANAYAQLIRFGSNGAFDPSFGAGTGFVSIGVPAVNSAITSVSGLLMTSDGKYLIAGTTGQGTSAHGFVARLTSNGTLDASFGNGGVNAVDWGTNGAVNAIQLQSDGAAVAAGQSLASDGVSLVGLARFNPDGSWDTRFGQNGKVSTRVDRYSVTINAMMIQSEGKIVVGGAASQNGGASQAILLRYQDNGAADSP